MTGSDTPARTLRYRPVWLALGMLLIAAVVAASLLTVPGPAGAPGIDKIYHVLAYGALMGWWGMVQPRRRLAWALGLLLLGLLMEGAQSLTGYRTLDRWDAAANTVGVLLALAVLQTPLSGLLAWVDGQLADRLDTRAP
ncbi:MAG: antibiotic resistance protein VanZ [Xanthomonadales bacterium]|nr:antibiotic resistance protein VanZ [Xanthomonadales bacterium]